MGIATKIPQNTFQSLQTDTGVILTSFDPSAPAIVDSAIVCATTGGINVVCQPAYSDFGEDVDNCPNNTKELKHLDGWDCHLSTTGLGTSPANIKLALGAADIDSQNSSKIVPRRTLSQSDFGNLWWVGDRADGGLVAVKIKNALSTGGFSIQTSKNGKGQISLEIAGHVSINDQDSMPMEFYSLDAAGAFSVVQNLVHVESTFDGNSIASGEDFSATLSAATGYTISSVIILLGGVDVTSDAYTSGTGAVAIDNVDGDIEIVAVANATT